MVKSQLHALAFVVAAQAVGSQTLKSGFKQWKAAALCSCMYTLSCSSESWGHTATIILWFCCCIHYNCLFSVPDLQVQIAFLYSEKPTMVDLECHNICGNSTYKWFRNGAKEDPGKYNQGKAGSGRYYRGTVTSEDSYACAVEGFEGFPSPSVCKSTPHGHEARCYGPLGLNITRTFNV